MLIVRRPIIDSHETRSKFASKWDGANVVKQVYTNGAYKLVDANRVQVWPINEKVLKRYYL